MAHYLIFQLGEGRYDGKPNVAESDLREMHSPQTAIPDPPPAFSMSGLGHFSYGLAWVVTAYRGHNLVWHNGGIDGFYALLSMRSEEHTSELQSRLHLVCRLLLEHQNSAPISPPHH